MKKRRNLGAREDCAACIFRRGSVADRIGGKLAARIERDWETAELTFRTPPGDGAVCYWRRGSIVAVRRGGKLGFRFGVIRRIQVESQGEGC